VTVLFFNRPSAGQPGRVFLIKTGSGDSRQGGGDEGSRGKTTVRPNQNQKLKLSSLRIKKPFARQSLN
jgi:hypothetical protein